MTGVRAFLAGALLALGACENLASSPHDGVGRSPPQIGAGMTAGRVSGN